MARMTDRIDEISRIRDVPNSEGPSSDSYNARNLARLVEEIEATSGDVINIEPRDAIRISNPPSLSAEAYKPTLVTLGSGQTRNSLIKSDQDTATRPIRLGQLDDRKTPPSGKMVQLVEYRDRGKGKRKLAA